ncbi:uncharacterized protein [Clytia hemisphaerica]|uniref:uncharacterized protein n=1 Tax=Clytia hemisphaerica TaxID=252671 RepID=UPI0034D6AE04
MADLPAKAASLKMKQFNGLNGCSVCYHPGENYRCWVYPYKGDQRDRKYAEVWRDAHLAEVNGAEENGVKGKSVVLDIQRIPEEAPFDYMHLVLEGEWKRKLLLLLDPRNGYITKGELEQLDQSVKAIKFPHDFKERVTEVSLESIRKAKASEQQLLILHILFPLLKGVLDEELFVHLGLLVTANHILNQDSASDQDVKNADTMLKTYHRLNEDLYNKSEMTYTNHALTHLAKQRKAHGCPLVLLSNFVFEGFIATLKRQYHGSTGVVSQMVRNVVVLQDLERYAEAFRGGALFEYVKEILYGKQLKMNKLEDNTKVQGIVDTLEHDVPDDISSFCNTNGAQYWQRMEVNSRMFHSLAYKRKGQSASYLAIINSNGKKLFGKILVFLSVHSFGFAMVQLFEKTQNRLFDNAYADENVAELVRENILGCGFIPLKLTKDIVLVRGAELSKRFLFVTNNEKTGFASEELYSYQHD